MSRGDGFDRMDVSTAIDDDPKFRALARRHPELLGVAGFAYLGLLARSWREGQQLTLEEGWPALMTWDQAAADALREVGLVDAETRIPDGPWAAWFGAASGRRDMGRDRQRRADEKRGRRRPAVSQAEQTDRQTVSQSGPTLDTRGSNVGPQTPNPEASGTPETEIHFRTCPGCGEAILPGDRGVVAFARDELWHAGQCPTRLVPEAVA